MWYLRAEIVLPTTHSEKCLSRRSFHRGTRQTVSIDQMTDVESVGTDQRGSLTKRVYGTLFLCSSETQSPSFLRVYLEQRWNWQGGNFPHEDDYSPLYLISCGTAIANATGKHSLRICHASLTTRPPGQRVDRSVTLDIERHKPTITLMQNLARSELPVLDLVRPRLPNADLPEKIASNPDTLSAVVVVMPPALTTARADVVDGATEAAFCVMLQLCILVAISQHACTDSFVDSLQSASCNNLLERLWVLCAMHKSAHHAARAVLVCCADCAFVFAFVLLDNVSPMTAHHATITFMQELMQQHLHRYCEPDGHVSRALCHVLRALRIRHEPLKRGSFPSRSKAQRNEPPRVINIKFGQRIIAVWHTDNGGEFDSSNIDAFCNAVSTVVVMPLLECGFCLHHCYDLHGHNLVILVALLDAMPDESSCIDRQPDGYMAPGLCLTMPLHWLPSGFVCKLCKRNPCWCDYCEPEIDSFGAAMSLLDFPVSGCAFRASCDAPRVLYALHDATPDESTCIDHQLGTGFLCERLLVATASRIVKPGYSSLAATLPVTSSLGLLDFPTHPTLSLAVTPSALPSARFAGRGGEEAVGAEAAEATRVDATTSRTGIVRAGVTAIDGSGSCWNYYSNTAQKSHTQVLRIRGSGGDNQNVTFVIDGATSYTIVNDINLLEAESIEYVTETHKTARAGSQIETTAKGNVHRMWQLRNESWVPFSLPALFSEHLDENVMAERDLYRVLNLVTDKFEDVALKPKDATCRLFDVPLLDLNGICYVKTIPAPSTAIETAASSSSRVNYALSLPTRSLSTRSSSTSSSALACVPKQYATEFAPKQYATKRPHQVHKQPKGRPRKSRYGPGACVWNSIDGKWDDPNEPENDEETFKQIASKLKHVYYTSKGAKPFMAQVSINNKLYTVGKYYDATEAAIAAADFKLEHKPAQERENGLPKYVNKNASGAYFGQFRVKGKLHYAGTFPNSSDANRAVIAARRELGLDVSYANESDLESDAEPVESDAESRAPDGNPNSFAQDLALLDASFLRETAQDLQHAEPNADASESENSLALLNEPPAPVADPGTYLQSLLGNNDLPAADASSLTGGASSQREALHNPIANAEWKIGPDGLYERVPAHAADISAATGGESSQASNCSIVATTGGKSSVPNIVATINNGVIVVKSTITNAGLGLFAQRPFTNKWLITEYSGKRLSDKFAAARCYPQTHLHHCCPTSHGHRGNDIYIDGLRTPIDGMGGGSFANHQPSKRNCNAEFALIRNRVYLRAKQDIATGDEIFVHCGSADAVDVMMGRKRCVVCPNIDGKLSIAMQVIDNASVAPHGLVTVSDVDDDHLKAAKLIAAQGGLPSQIDGWTFEFGRRGLTGRFISPLGVRHLRFNSVLRSLSLPELPDELSA